MSVKKLGVFALLVTVLLGPTPALAADARGLRPQETVGFTEDRNAWRTNYHRNPHEFLPMHRWGGPNGQTSSVDTESWRGSRFSLNLGDLLRLAMIQLTNFALTFASLFWSLTIFLMRPTWGQRIMDLAAYPVHRVAYAIGRPMYTIGLISAPLLVLRMAWMMAAGRRAETVRTFTSFLLPLGFLMYVLGATGEAVRVAERQSRADLAERSRVTARPENCLRLTRSNPFQPGGADRTGRVCQPLGTPFWFAQTGEAILGGLASMFMDALRLEDLERTLAFDTGSRSRLLWDTAGRGVGTGGSKRDPDDTEAAWPGSRANGSLPSCRRYVETLRESFQQHAEDRRGSDPATVASERLTNRIWELSVLVPWLDLQFGSNPLRNRMWCQVLETEARVPQFERARLMEASHPMIGSWSSNHDLFRSDLTDGSWRQMTGVWWLACTFNDRAGRWEPSIGMYYVTDLSIHKQETEEKGWAREIPDGYCGGVHRFGFLGYKDSTQFFSMLDRWLRTGSSGPNSAVFNRYLEAVRESAATSPADLGVLSVRLSKQAKEVLTRRHGISFSEARPGMGSPREAGVWWRANSNLGRISGTHIDRQFGDNQIPESCPGPEEVCPENPLFIQWREGTAAKRTIEDWQNLSVGVGDASSRLLGATVMLFTAVAYFLLLGLLGLTVNLLSVGLVFLLLLFPVMLYGFAVSRQRGGWPSRMLRAMVVMVGLRSMFVLLLQLVFFLIMLMMQGASLVVGTSAPVALAKFNADMLVFATIPLVALLLVNFLARKITGKSLFTMARDPVGLVKAVGAAASHGHTAPGNETAAALRRAAGLAKSWARTNPGSRAALATALALHRFASTHKPAPSPSKTQPQPKTSDSPAQSDFAKWESEAAEHAAGLPDATDVAEEQVLARVGDGQPGTKPRFDPDQRPDVWSPGSDEMLERERRIGPDIERLAEEYRLEALSVATAMHGVSPITDGAYDPAKLAEIQTAAAEHWGVPADKVAVSAHGIPVPYTPGFASPDEIPESLVSHPVWFASVQANSPRVPDNTRTRTHWATATSFELLRNGQLSAPGGALRVHSLPNPKAIPTTDRLATAVQDPSNRKDLREHLASRVAGTASGLDHPYRSEARFMDSQLQLVAGQAWHREAAARSDRLKRVRDAMAKREVPDG